jgi:hypothetical protein
MAYDTFYLGWAYETTHGTSLIANAGSTAYKVGSVTDNILLPDPEWDLLEVAPDAQTRTTKELIKTRARPVAEAFAFLPHNGLPFYWALGDSSTAGTVHTLTASSTAELPSLTFHAERLDSAAVLSDWVTQYTGMRNLITRVFCGDDHPELTTVMGWLGTSVADTAFALTSKPSDVTGTHTSPLHYLWTGSTHTYDGNSIEGITYWEIAIENGTHAAPPDYGSVYPSAVYQGPHQKVYLTVRYTPQEQTLHDDLLTSTVPNKNWEFEFVRDATDDKLKFTCTTATTISHRTMVPSNAGEHELEFRSAITSLTVTVTDQINASFYGD